MKRELASFLAAISSDAPLVLIIDDLHWADTSTAELLAYLAKREGLDGVVFMLATDRLRCRSWSSLRPNTAGVKRRVCETAHY
jgi:predicted ATPase